MESVFISVKDIVPPPPSLSELDSCGSTKSSGEDESDSNSSLGSHILPSDSKRSEETKYSTCDSPLYENLYQCDAKLVSYNITLTLTMSWGTIKITESRRPLTSVRVILIPESEL